MMKNIRKILSSSITMIATAISLVYCYFWYSTADATGKYEPLIYLITSSAAFVATLITKFTDEEKSVNIDNQNNNYYEYHQKTTWIERLIQEIGLIDMIDRIKEKTKHTRDLTHMDHAHDVINHSIQHLPSYKDELLDNLDALSSTIPDDIHIDGAHTDMDGNADFPDDITSHFS